MKQNSLSEFGTIRSFLWPIYGHEMRKFVPMLLMLFFISFNYTILRNMKDAVVVTNAGAEVIPFIKVWTLLPIAILLTVVFNKLSDFFSQENAFYMMVSGFLQRFVSAITECKLFRKYFAAWPKGNGLHVSSLDIDFLLCIF